MLSEAQEYSKRGWVIHPLRSPDAKCKSPGKQPILTEWQKRTEPATEKELREWFENTDNNIGLVCGEASGTTIIDVDGPTFQYVFEGVDLDTLKSARTQGRGHLFFQYEPSLRSQKHHDLELEILSNGNNAVLPPSVHVSGDVYRWADPDAPLQKMPDGLKKNLTALFEAEKKLNSIIGVCRPCFREMWKEKPSFHGAGGRRALLAFTTELKANGATINDILLLAKIAYKQDFDEETTITEADNADPKKTWKCDTIQRELDKFFDVKRCETCKQQFYDEEYVPEEIKNSALDIMKNYNVVDYLTTVANTIHVGDTELLKFLLVAVASQSCLNSQGLHPKLSGESGTGKSHACKTILHLIPDKFKLSASFSSKALFYDEKLQDGCIVFSDDTDLTPEIEGTIKRANTNFQELTEHQTVDQNKKGVKLIIPPRISFWFTSVNNAQSQETLNRQILMDPDDSRATSEKVMRHQLRLAVLGLPEFFENDDVKICREIMRDVKTHRFTVVIPYGDNIIWSDVDNRRNLSIFLDMIKSFTILNHMQRDREGAVLTSSIEDYDSARKLYLSKAEGQKYKLTKKEMELIRIMANNPDVEWDYPKLQDRLGVGKARISQLMHGKNGGTGLLDKVSGLKIHDTTEKTDDTVTEKRVWFEMSSGTSFKILESYDEMINIQVPDETKVRGGLPILQSVYPEFTQKKVNPNVTMLKSQNATCLLSDIINNNNNNNNIIINGGSLPFFQERIKNETSKNISGQSPIHSYDGKQGKSGKLEATDSEKQKVNEGNQKVNRVNDQKTAIDLHLLTKELIIFKKAHYVMAEVIEGEDFLRRFLEAYNVYRGHEDQVRSVILFLNRHKWKI